jgi:hypothetical protein
MWRSSWVFDEFGDFMEGRVGMLFYRFAKIQVNNPEQLAKSTQNLENMIQCVKYLIGFEFESPKIL